MSASTARPPARLVHAADCHLGAPGGGTVAAEAFERLIRLTMEARADALVIAGDLFDTVRVDADLLMWVARELDRLDCPVVIIPGNHDHCGAGSPFERFDFTSACGARVVRNEDGELIDDASRLFSFWGRAVHEHVPEFRPLAGIPQPSSGRWGVVVGHGLVVADASRTDRGSPIDSNDLHICGWDYVALGHFGRFRQVQADPVPAYYAGETVDRPDCPGGAVVVDFAEGAPPRVAWRPLRAEAETPLELRELTDRHLPPVNAPAGSR